MDRTHAKFIFNAISCAHEFCTRAVSKLECLVKSLCSCFSIHPLRESIRHVLFVRDILYGRPIIRHISANLSVKNVFFIPLPCAKHHLVLEMAKTRLRCRPKQQF